MHEHSIGNSFDRCDPDKTFFINNLEFLSSGCITSAKLMKQAGPEFLTDVELNQEKASQTGEFSTEPTFYNHLNRVRVYVTPPEHSLHRYTLTSELRARLLSFHEKFYSHVQIGSIKSAES